MFVDDGSEDESFEIARQASQIDDRIQVIQQARQGQATARNAGVAHAAASWVVFLDADDEIAPSHLADLVLALTTKSDACLAVSGGRRVFADASLGEPEFPPPPPYFRSLARRNEFFIHMCLLSRSTFEDAGRFIDGERYCEDWDLWQRVARLDRPVALTSKATALYHVSPASMSHDVEPMIRAGIKVIARGHQADPRVDQPAEWAAQGMDPFWADSATFFYVFWACSVAVGAESYRSELLELAGNLPSEIRVDHMLNTYRAGIAWALAQVPNAVTSSQLMRPGTEVLLRDLEEMGADAGVVSEFEEQLRC